MPTPRGTDGGGVRPAPGPTVDVQPAADAAPTVDLPTGSPSSIHDVSPSASVPSGAQRYALERELGRGGMGRVVDAEDRQFGRKVAVKCLLPGASEDTRARFVNEAVVTGTLSHGGIPGVYERGVLDDGTPFFAMQKIVGRSLAEVLCEAKTSSERLRLLTPLVLAAQTVAYAHSRGVVHRDLKPSNIVVGTHGQVVVVDWGLAKIGEGVPSLARAVSGSGSAELTVDGQVVGTPAYMAPEQAQGRLDEIDARTDVFGLGALLYRILTGEPPFWADSSDAALERATQGSFRPIRELNPAAPAALVELCEAALRRDPSERLRSAELFAERLEAFMLEAVSSTAARVANWGSAVFGLSALAVGITLFLVAVTSDLVTMAGIWGPVFFVLTGLGCALSTVEWVTRGRYHLSSVALSLMFATTALSIGAYAIGTAAMFEIIRTHAIPSDADYRVMTATGHRIALSALWLGMVFAAVQGIAWGVARRRASQGSRSASA